MDNDSDSDVGDLLNDLLESNDDTGLGLDQKQKTALKELDFNFLEAETNSVKKSSPKKLLTSLVHDDNLDSSDDEEKRNAFEQNYSESGRNLKSLLKKIEIEKHNQSITIEVLRDSKNSLDINSTQTNNLSQSKSFSLSTLSQVKRTNTSSLLTTSNSSALSSVDVYSDPVFGLRIIKPLVSSSELQSLMLGKTPVKISKVKTHLATANLEGDWVIAGVLISKSPTMKSQKGNNYCIWKLSDLSFDMNVVTLFLFSDAYKKFWKTAAGTVLGVMNPNVLESKDEKDLATLSTDSAGKVLILGTSKDMGVCKSVTKAGNPCTAVVNRNKCEYCVYHVQKEYKQCSRRADLQSSGNGRSLGSPLNAKGFAPKKIQPAITQGQPHNFFGVPAKRNAKLDQKDRERLALLTGAKKIEKKEDNPEKEKQFVDTNLEGKSVEEKNPEKKKHMVELTSNQAKKDFDRLNKLKKLASKAESESQASREEFLSQNKSPGNLTNLASPRKEGFTLSKLQEMKDESAAPFSKTPGFTRSKLQEWSVKQGYGTSSQDKNSAPSIAKPFNLNGLSRSSKSSTSLSKSKSLEQSFGPIKNALDSPAFSSPSVPRLGNGVMSGSIDFSVPISKKQVDVAKLNALKFVRQKGGFSKSNVNKILESKEKKEQNLKRKRDPDDVEMDDKKLKEAKKLSEKFKQLMEATSAHVNLIEKSEEEEKEKYFGKLEIKEKMEEKMMTTFKIDCKAVTCSVCKYTAFSSSDMCKELRHPIRVINTVKRFFKCRDCGNRTVALDKMPKLSCNKCNSSNWLRAPMMDEKKAAIPGAGLSIRGGEEKFIGSYVQDANLNLLVPE
ncbi:protein MCM10 homolog [Belonocnema kinseyi]|uniref:protein MCM10 homolog n=1 Tax=Belonocnema kinseyi TaxID=2817044 RepID=UPI00143D51BF|nr:protein MCM10 homolog [Belonocnema kinseyi]